VILYSIGYRSVNLRTLLVRYVEMLDGAKRATTIATWPAVSDHGVIRAVGKREKFNSEGNAKSIRYKLSIVIDDQIATPYQALVNSISRWTYIIRSVLDHLY